MTKPQPVVAVVDDDEIFQVIARKMINICAPQWTIKTFMNGAGILQHLKENLTIENELPEVIFLDINMPRIDGWMFLDEFHDLKSRLAETPRIYLTSSSIDPKDITRAKSNPDLVDYIIKPLTIDVVKRILTN